MLSNYALAEDSRARCKAKVGRCFHVIAVPLGNVPREVVVSPAYHLHPEFGLLCPPRRFRRKASVAFALLAFLAIVGALALKVGHDPDTDGALIAHGDVARTDTETVQTVRQPTAATIAESSPPLEASATACEGDPSSQIGVQCSVGRARKLRSLRAANEAPMIAALPLGRTAPPAPASPAAPLNPEDVANIAIATPVVPASTGPPPQRSRRCENRRVGMVATIYRATGDGATGALVLTLCPTTATCAVPTNGHGAGRPGEGARWL
jgi:hypothetical protein